MKKPSSIHHLAIQVENISRAVKWYQDHFDCTIKYEDASWAILAFDNINLALVLPNQHPPHIAVVHPHIEEFGTPKLHRDGTRSVYIQDSEGNFVELLDLH